VLKWGGGGFAGWELYRNCKKPRDSALGSLGSVAGEEGVEPSLLLCRGAGR